MTNLIIMLVVVINRTDMIKFNKSKNLSSKLEVNYYKCKLGKDDATLNSQTELAYFCMAQR